MLLQQQAERLRDAEQKLMKVESDVRSVHCRTSLYSLLMIVMIASGVVVWYELVTVSISLTS